MRATSALVLAGLLFAGCASMRSSDMSTLPANATWGAVPVFPGAKLAALQGNPAQPGPFVYRVWFPADFKVAAHFHPAVENVTVLSGTFHVGMGDKLDPAKGERLTAGGFISVPAGHRHYAWTTSETVIQVHGVGPTSITFVNAADDPRRR
jgi:mannose-6-phosphate isomerase-like protein (cupin superfamily)